MAQTYNKAGTTVGSHPDIRRCRKRICARSAALTLSILLSTVCRFLRYNNCCDRNGGSEEVWISMNLYNESHTTR